MELLEKNVVAKYVEGLSVQQISKTLGIPMKEVKKIVDELQNTNGNNLVTVNDFIVEQNLDSSLADLIHQNTAALRNISRQAQDPDYVRDQSSASLGQLYEKIGNFTVRLLEAASHSKSKESK